MLWRETAEVNKVLVAVLSIDPSCTYAATVNPYCAFQVRTLGFDVRLAAQDL